MHTVNQFLDFDSASAVAKEFGVLVQRVSLEEEGLQAEAAGGALGAAGAGGDHHGPRRPRQDLAARRDPQDERHHDREGRITQHIGAYTSSTRRARSSFSTRRPRGLHRNARPRREGHGHRRARRRGRRRRHAADRRGARPRQGGGGADHRGGQQNRQARRQARAGADPARGPRTDPRDWGARRSTSRSRPRRASGSRTSSR